MRRRVEGRGVRSEERLSAVAVVDVDVDHGHALGAVRRLFIPSHNSKNGRRFVLKKNETDPQYTGIAESNTSEYSCMQPVQAPMCLQE